MKPQHQKGDVMIWRATSVDGGIKLLVAEYPHQGDPNEIRLIDKHGCSCRFRKQEGADTFPLLKETTAKRPPELVDEYERTAVERYRKIGKIAS